MAWRFWVLLATGLACATGCGSKNETFRQAETLARQITDNADRSYASRDRAVEQVDEHVVFKEKFESLTVEEDQNGKLILRLRKWHCIGDESEPCGDQSVPIEYVIHPEHVWPSMVYHKGPYPIDAGRGVVYLCDTDADIWCVQFDGIGDFGGYKPVTERQRDTPKGALKATLETGAEMHGMMRAPLQTQTIECPDEERCESIERDFRQLVELVQAAANAIPPKQQAKYKKANAALVELAKDITKDAKGAASRRYDEESLFNNEVRGTAGLGFHKEDSPTDGIRQAQLVKHYCFDDQQLLGGGANEELVCSDRNSISSIFGVNLDLVDPASIRVASPDAGIGEHGSTVEFHCQSSEDAATPAQRRECIEYKGSRKSDDAHLCAGDDCGEEIEAILKLTAKRDVDNVAASGAGDLDCDGRRACKRTAKHLRTMVELAAAADGDAHAESPESPAYQARATAYGMNEKLTGVTVPTDVGARTKYAVNVVGIGFRPPTSLTLSVKYLTKHDTDLKDERLTAQPGVIRVDVTKLHVEGLEVVEDPEDEGPPSLVMPCTTGDCFEIDLQNHRGSRGDWAIPCRDKGDCKAMRKDVRKLMDIAQHLAPQPTKKGSRQQKAASPEAKRFASLAADLDIRTVGAWYKSFNPDAAKVVKFEANQATVLSDGRLEVFLVTCTYDREQVQDCDENSAWAVSTTYAALADFGREETDVRVQAFMLNGNARDPLGILDMALPPGYREAVGEVVEADSFAIIANCEDDTECATYDFRSQGSRAYIPCPDRDTCDELAAGLRELIDVAHGPEYDTILAEYKTIAFPTTEITSVKEARAAAKRIEQGLDQSELPFDAPDGRQYDVRTTGVEFDEPGALRLETMYQGTVVDGRPVTGLGTTTFDLVQLDPGAIRRSNAGNGIDNGMFIGCGEPSCVSVELGPETYAPAEWLVDCKTRDGCRDVAADIKGLIAFAKSQSDERDPDRTPAPVPMPKPESRVDPAPKKPDPAEPTIHADLSRTQRKQLNIFHQATYLGEARLLDSYGRATRLLRGRGASISHDRALIAHREASMALRPLDTGAAYWQEPDALFQDYDLKLTLGLVDRGSVEVRQGVADNGEEGYWIEAQCDGDVPCASIVVLGNPLHIRLQAETIMRSLGESEFAPKLRFPCIDKKECDKAAKALRTLIKKAPKPKRDSSSEARSRGGDLVGTWYLHTPYQPTWVVEYRADGTFTFTTPTAVVNGEYQAKNGSWTSRAAAISSDDGGTYRLIDKSTLEMNGKLGPSIWKRRK